MFELKYRSIVLRNPCEKDLEDYNNWLTIDIEWQNWDAPWEIREEEDVEQFLSRIRDAVGKSPDISYRLEIQTDDGQHIGWVSSYLIDDDETKRAVGIDIPPACARGKGHGKYALILFMAYLFEKTQADTLYTQTWSGNYPMLALAEYAGFAETRRIKDLREVCGKKFDALTFAISKADFIRLHGDIMK